MHFRPASWPGLLLLLAVALATVLSGGLPGGLPAGPASAQGASERIAAYNVFVRIEGSGDILVEETIDYDFGPQDRHGIFRDIPVRLRYDDVRAGYDRVYPLEVVSVSGSPGTPAGYTTESQGDATRLIIGDPDRTISGRHTYTIVYRMRSVLNDFPDHVELFWNAVGAGWSVPIESPQVRVEAPAGITQVACFAGPEGSTLPCADATHNGATANFSAERLQPFESFTVVVGLPVGAVTVGPPVLEERWSLARAFSLTTFTVGSAALLMAAAIAGFAALAWRTGRDRRWVGSETDVVFGNVAGEHQPVGFLERHRPPVEFVPPDGVRPGQVGTLVDEVAHPLDVTATIIDLAVRGHLRIDEIPGEGWFAKDDWELVRLEGGAGLASYESLLLEALFEDGPTVRLSELRTHFATHLDKVQDALYEDAVDQGWFVTRPDRVRSRWKALGVVLALVGTALVVAAAAWTELALVPVPVLVGGLLVVGGARWMPRRTAKGTATLRRVLGFRRLIDESEAERAQFAERQNLFSEYLPYAVVFGCTEKWARAFSGLDDRLPETGWYNSPNAFSLHAFTHSIDSFSVTTAGTLTATPAGSGSSGFGGGGFSGGGAGGGGGGSW